jgi:hypothetical protein
VEIQNVVYSMNRMEFMLLAGFAGLPQIYGIRLPMEELTEESFLQTLNGMMRKGIMLNHDEKLVIAPEYSEMLQRIKDAVDYVVVSPQDDTIPVSFCYLGSTLVTVVPSAVNVNQIKLQMIDPKGFYQYLEDMGYLPEAGRNEKLADIWVKNEEILQMLPVEDGWETLEDDKTKLILEKRKLEQVNPVCRICIRQEGLSDILVYSGKEEVQRELFSRASMQKLLDIMLEGLEEKR